MKREKVQQIVEDVLTSHSIRSPITVSTLVIDFGQKTFTLRGRTVTFDTEAVSIPILSTDHLIIHNGKDIV